MKEIIMYKFICLFISINYVFAGCGQPSYQNDYDTLYFKTSTALRCVYNIKVNGHRLVELKFSLFNVPGIMPYCGTSKSLKVSIGCGSYATYLTSFCSTNMDTLPHNIYARDGCIKLDVETKGAGSFTASYTSKEPDDTYFSTSQCLSHRNLYSASGVIASPNWPRPYEINNFPYYKRQCEWDIKILDSKKLLKVSFMDVDIYRYSSSCRSDEKLQMKVREYKRTYCEMKPFSEDARHYQIEIKMQINSNSNNNRGFVLGWVAYNHGKIEKNTRLEWIIGGILLCVVCFVFVFCCYRYCKRKKSPTPVATTTTTSYGTSPPVNQSILQKPAGYSQQGYIPTQSHPQQPMAGYPQQPYPPQQQYPPPPAQPYMQNYPMAPQTQPPVQEGYANQPPPPYPGPPNDSMAPQPPPPFNQSAPYPPPL